MKRILIVEDDEAIRISLTQLLENEGYDVSVASNGQVALDYLAVADPLPELILLDLMMPQMDGATFRNRQLADPRLKHTPVVVMSADSVALTKLKSVSGKACIKKPIDIEVLLETIIDSTASRKSSGA